jgi:hypothetical protein
MGTKDGNKTAKTGMYNKDGNKKDENQKKLKNKYP